TRSAATTPTCSAPRSCSPATRSPRSRPRSPATPASGSPPPTPTPSITPTPRSSTAPTCSPRSSTASTGCPPSPTPPTRPASPPPQPARLFVGARLRALAEDAEFVFATTHFDNNSPSQERSAPLVLERTASLGAELPVILVGDFNSQPVDPAYDLLTRGVDGQ